MSGLNNHLGTKEADAQRDMSNRKPYRSKALQAAAKKTARLCEDGTHRSSTEVLYHPPAKKGM